MAIRKYIVPALAVAALTFTGCTDEIDGTAHPAETGERPQSQVTPNPLPEEKSAPPLPLPETDSPPTPEVSPEVANATNSAQSYVDMSGFSKNGLIDQLSSEYGEGYPKDVATEAVESLDVDWKQEAVESAESYLDMSGFSRSRLIDQLTSDYGEQFTQKQAEYAVDQVY